MTQTCPWTHSPTQTSTRTSAFWWSPSPHDYPYYWVILDPKSKEDKVKVTYLKNLHYTRHTFSSCLIRCANMKSIRQVLLKILSGHDSVHRRTDRQMDKVKAVYPPFNFIEALGYNELRRIYYDPDFPTNTFPIWLHSTLAYAHQLQILQQAICGAIKDI